MPALHGWHGEDRSDRWDENGDILDDEDGNDDQHDLEIASWYTWTEHDGNDNDDNVKKHQASHHWIELVPLGPWCSGRLRLNNAEWLNLHTNQPTNR